MNTATYKGYIARIEPDLDDGILVGRVINTRDIIGFHGETIAEAINSFHAAIDEYIEDCRDSGTNPNKPYSGKFNLRLSPKLHSEIAMAAAKADKSLNQWVTDKLEQAANNG
ncbi:MAG: type II toxin-antitoxin system HicB family antitoxin [Deltaproteobacteria bacterium]|nr:type II toxin-antitoxin system HicB family antitoxin [Deltaproteobacteria bacterium]MBW1816551.1 type II toxin-antitoxin system HicB family antitoxin [Deltaproteobacteria bacterium]